MDFSVIIPTAKSIPTSWNLLQGLLLLTFILHIIFVNILIGSVIIVSLYMVISKNLTNLVDKLAKKTSIIMAFVINTGIAPLLFIHIAYGQFIFTSSVLMSVWWISSVFFMITAYYLLYVFNLKSKSKTAFRTLIWLTSTSMILLVGFIMSNNMTLMLLPEKWMSYFNTSNGTLTNLSEPMLIPRYLHFICASIAVAGLFLAWIDHLTKHTEEKDYIEWFVKATMLQIPIGIFFLFSLTPEVRKLFTGNDFYKTSLLSLSLLSALISLFLGYKKKLLYCTIASLCTIILMVLLRDQVRKTYLNTFFNPADLTIETQYGLFIIFAIIACLVVVALTWIIRVTLRRKEESNSL